MTALTQYSFDPLVYVDEQGLDYQTAAKAAQRDRDAKMRELRKSGANCKGWTLTGQLRKYRSFGVECGRVRNVYYLSVYPQ